MTTAHMTTVHTPAVAPPVSLAGWERLLLVDPSGAYWLVRPEGTRQPEPQAEDVAWAWYCAGHTYRIQHTTWDGLAAVPVHPGGRQYTAAWFTPTP